MAAATDLPAEEVVAVVVAVVAAGSLVEVRRQSYMIVGNNTVLQQLWHWPWHRKRLLNEEEEVQALEETGAPGSRRTCPRPGTTITARFCDVPLDGSSLPRRMRTRLQ